MAELEAIQSELAHQARDTERWRFPAERPAAIGGVFIAYRTGISGVGEPGDPAWAAATVIEGNVRTAVATVEGTVGAPYIAGYLALREGQLLEQVVRQLIPQPEVLLVDATGLDHPRRAGLALQLGAVLDLPTVGVTDRTLIATAEEPGRSRGDRAPLLIGDELAGYALRTRDGVRRLFVHAGWRTDPKTACEVLLAATTKTRTPEPLREARRLARAARGTPSRSSPGGRHLNMADEVGGEAPILNSGRGA